MFYGKNNIWGTSTIVNHAPQTNIKNITRVKPLPHDDAITREHKADLYALADKWVELKAIQSPRLKISSLYSSIRKRINQQAKSIGKNGVVSIHEFPDCDFERAKKFLKQQIAILNKVPKVMSESELWRNDTISAIQTKCNDIAKARGIGLKDFAIIRKAYQKQRFKKDSLSIFDTKQLEEMRAYVFSKNPSFDINNHREILNTQQHRERSFNLLCDELGEQAKEVNSTFDRYHITIKKHDFLTMLF